MSNIDDLDFHPERADEERTREEEERFRRRVRREVLRVQRGEADEDIAADEAAEAEARTLEEEEERRRAKRRAHPFFRLLSGTVLVTERATRYYPYLVTIAVMFFLNIVVVFWSLHLDMRYSRLEREVQRLRERSVRLEEQRYRISTHSAVVEEIARRGLGLKDPEHPNPKIP
ncbi:MAG: hypothetical protein IJN98_06370 [Alistipes sp.]|nr:hypothetical protein [Alistipes sp.]